MSFDKKLFGAKVRRYREQFQVSPGDLAAETGLAIDTIEAFERGEKAPSGDDILILADFFKCDYKFFVSNEKVAPMDQTDALFRRHGDEFSPQDRWALQEVLFLADNEAFLQKELSKPILTFSFQKKGEFYKGHGWSAAEELRRLLGYTEPVVPSDVYSDFRRLGIHVFRRKLQNSNVSGVFLKHPIAGPCVLINYNEDVYRQRFTIAHEAAHAILDRDEDFVVSFAQSKELPEIRANAFAGRFLLPHELFANLHAPNPSDSQFIDWANKLKVNPETLSIALSDAKLIDDNAQQHYRQLKIPRDQKVDPELPSSLAPGVRARKEALLERGLSDYYVRLCIEGYSEGVVSAGRLTEMLLASRENECEQILDLFGEKLSYAS